MLGLLVMCDVALVSASHLCLEILWSAFFDIIVIITSSFLSSDSGSSSIESLLESYSPAR
jgi:hypothetical protein